MLLSHGDEIAVMMRRCIKPPRCALLRQPFAPFSSRSFTFPSPRLCAQASNELVWFPRPATGTFLPPSASSTSSTHHEWLMCWLFSPLSAPSPPRTFQVELFFPRFLPPSAFVFPWRRRIQPVALPQAAGVRTARSAYVVLPRCEKCISACIIALRRDTGSITPGSAAER